MRPVVADTGPINYLILVGHSDLLFHVFGKVIVPRAVWTELSDPGAPLPVQRWIAAPPTWVEVIETHGLDHIPGLHKGEAEAIALAASLHADLLLMDDRRGVCVAKSQGLRVTGTLGVFDLAAERGLIDFAKAIHALRGTTFRTPAAVLKALLAKHSRSSSV